MGSSGDFKKLFEDLYFFLCNGGNGAGNFKVKGRDRWGMEEQGRDGRAGDFFQSVVDVQGSGVGDGSFSEADVVLIDGVELSPGNVGGSGRGRGGHCPGQLAPLRDCSSVGTHYCLWTAAGHDLVFEVEVIGEEVDEQEI